MNDQVTVMEQTRPLCDNIGHIKTKNKRAGFVKMTLLYDYQAKCAMGAVIADPEQVRVLRHLDGINSDLKHEERQRGKFFAFLRKPRQVKGAYIWGGVGVGKTFMMDAFYHNLATNKKLRLHFHAFMRLIHQRLKELQGNKNPIDGIVDELAEKAVVLCLDELLVTDIADAMILARLFSAIHTRGICLMVTSNMKPDDLYQRGLQRDSFLPAIELLKNMTTIIHVPSTYDYRERHLDDKILAERALKEIKMEQDFSKIAKGTIHQNTIEIAGHKIQVKKRADNAIWFDFDEICRVPRSQHDYLDIAEKYKTVFISNIRPISAEEKNTISLFIRMIDVFYDAGIQLVYSSEKQLDAIYTAGHMLFDYARTRSRLIEMNAEK